jgi:hypothetical protein
VIGHGALALAFLTRTPPPSIIITWLSSLTHAWTTLNRHPQADAEYFSLLRR